MFVSSQIFRKHILAPSLNSVPTRVIVVYEYIRVFENLEFSQSNGSAHMIEASDELGIECKSASGACGAVEWGAQMVLPEHPVRSDQRAQTPEEPVVLHVYEQLFALHVRQRRREVLNGTHITREFKFADTQIAWINVACINWKNKIADPILLESTVCICKVSCHFLF